MRRRRASPKERKTRGIPLQHMYWPAGALLAVSQTVVEMVPLGTPDNAWQLPTASKRHGLLEEHVAQAETARSSTPAVPFIAAAGRCRFVQTARAS